MKKNQRKLGQYLCKKWYSLAIFYMVLMGASFCMFDASASALTTVPTKTNFQGRLTNSAGNIMPDGLYNMKFRLFTVSSGGTDVWNETRETTNRVQVTNGLFSVRLGDVTPIPASLFASGSLYFEVELPTPGTATCSTAACASFTEGPMTPRNQMATSAYAYNSETLDGLDSSDFAAASGSANYIQNTTTPQSANISITGPANSSAVLSIGVGSSTGNLAVIGNGSTTGLSINNSGNTSVYADLTVDTNTLVVNSATNRVGIGTAPSHKLHVADTITTDNGANMGSYFGLTINPSSAPGAASSYSSVYSLASSTSANLNANTLLYGVNGIANNGGVGTLGAGVGVIGRAQNVGTGGISNATGVYGAVASGGAGTISNATAIHAASPTVTAGTITNAYGLLVGAQSGAGITNGYGIYQQGTSDINHFAGSARVHNTSTSAFTVANASAASVLVADTTNSRVQIGSTTADSTGVVLVLDTKNDAGDPTGVDGAMYYNSSTQSFRCYQGGEWRSCIGGLAASSTAAQTISGTTATDWTKQYTIPANNCVPGRVYRITARGVYSTGFTAGTVTVSILAGSTTIQSTSVAPGGSATNRQWVMRYDIICQTAGASGTVEGAGNFDRFTAAATSTTTEMLNTAPITLNTTISQVLKVRTQATQAATSVTVRQVIIESLGP